MDWVEKEMRMKTKLDYNPKGFSIAEDHLILRFWSKAECAGGAQGQSLVCGRAVAGNGGVGAKLCTWEEGDP